MKLIIKNNPSGKLIKRTQIHGILFFFKLFTYNNIRALVVKTILYYSN